MSHRKACNSWQARGSWMSMELSLRSLSPLVCRCSGEGENPAACRVRVPALSKRRGCEVSTPLTSPPVSDTTLLKGREMPRTDPLFERTVQGWARLNPAQRERFFQAGLRAALRLERREFREWLRRRIGEPPLVAPVDPARFAISKVDIALLLAGLGSRRNTPNVPPVQPAPTGRLLK